MDRLTKMRHLIPCHTTTDAKQVAKLFLHNVWKLHGLPTHVTSDRGTQFTAKFWKTLCQQLKIEARMSTAYHPETDGQTERINAIMEQYLRAYVSYQQNDWSEWLPMAEFAANNQISETTKATPFFANYGFHLRFQVGITLQGHTAPETDAKDFASRMTELHEWLGTQVRTAQDKQEQYTNSNRIPAPRYQAGDMVFVSLKNIRTTRNSRKLDWKKAGPYPVKKVVSPYAYEIELPPTMVNHPVFHVSLLEPAATDPIAGQVQAPPPPVVTQGEQEWEVEEILDAKVLRGTPSYYVKWTGYHQPSWEPASYHDETAAVDVFHQQYPNKPGPWDSKPRRSSRLKKGATFTDSGDRKQGEL